MMNEGKVQNDTVDQNRQLEEKNEMDLQQIVEAAENGDILAMKRLVLMYETGEGVEIDAGKASDWQLEILSYYFKRWLDGLLTQEEKEKFLNNLTERILAEIKLGRLDYAFGLGSLYYLWGKNLMMDHDYPGAKALFEKAAAACELLKAVEGAEPYDPTYCRNLYGSLGCVCEMAETPEEAIKWYEKAAELGDAAAQYKVACWYDEKAMEWFRKAAEQSYAPAQSKLGSYYYDGHGVPQDYVKAVKWYQKAAEQGDAESQFLLGLCYRFGHGVGKKSEKAAEWFQKAAEQGNRDAQDYNVPQSVDTLRRRIP